MLQLKKKNITNRMYLDIEIDGVSSGRVIIGIYGKIFPKTAGRFLIDLDTFIWSFFTFHLHKIIFTYLCRHFQGFMQG